MDDTIALKTGRQRFEAHLRPFGYLLARAEGDYVDSEVRAAWSTWRAAYAAAAAGCEEIALSHHQVDGAYAAGKKAGALECAAVFKSV